MSGVRIPAGAPKNIPRLLAGDIFSGRSRGVEVYPRQGKSPLEHQNRENQQSIKIAGFSLFINALRRFWKAFRREKRRGFTTVFRIMQAHFANKMLTARNDMRKSVLDNVSSFGWGGYLPRLG